MKTSRFYDLEGYFSINRTTGKLLLDKINSYPKSRQANSRAPASLLCYWLLSSLITIQ